MSSPLPEDTFTIEKPEITLDDRLKELKLELPDLPCQVDTVFGKLTGWGWKRDIKERIRLLKKNELLLETCLIEGEQIVYIAKGTQYVWMESYMIGIWAHSINQTVLVLTNVRILLFRTDGSGTPKQTFWMVFYSQIKKLKGTLAGMLVLKLADGRTLKFSGFKKSDRKTMPAIFQDAVARFQEQGFSPTTSQSLENLCSHCLEQVPKLQYECDHCETLYWTPYQLAWRSFVFPSWGDFLMGHTMVAFIEMIGALFTWGILLNGINESLVQADSEPFVLGVMVFVIANGLDAAVTSYVAGKGLHPRTVTQNFV